MPFGSPSLGKAISKQIQIILLETTPGEMKVVLWFPSSRVPVLNLAMALSDNRHTFENHDLQPLSLEEKQVLNLKNLSLSETDLSNNSDDSSKKI